MELHVVCIYVWKGQAFAPVTAKSKSGFFVDVEPVYKSNLTIEALERLIHDVTASGIQQIPDPTRNEMKQLGEQILESIGVESWRELMKGGSSYTIEFSQKGVRLDTFGRWEFDPAKTKLFPLNSSLADIGAAILEDIAG